MPDLSFALHLAWQSAILPFAVTVTILLLARSAAIALVAGFLASYFTIFHAQWAWLPRQSLDVLPWIVVLGAAAAVGRRMLRGLAAQLVVPIVAAISIAATGWFALAGLGLERVLTVVVAGTLLTWGAWLGIGRSDDSRSMGAPLLMVVSGGSALALMLDSSQALGQLAGALATTCIGFVVLRAAGRGQYFDRAVSGVAILLLGTLLCNAYLYAGFPLLYIALLLSGLLAGPLVAMLRHTRGQRNDSGAWIMTTGLAAVPVLTVVVMAVNAAQEMGGY